MGNAVSMSYFKYKKFIRNVVDDELWKQKDRIIEMDSRIVGRSVEPYVSENQGRNTRIKQSFV
jgi:phage-related protein